MYTLYGSRGSGSAAVEAALTLAGQPFRLVRAATWEPDSALEELRRVNPLQQIPTLVLPDGSVMTESAACLIHLGLVYPGSGLLPEDPSRRAQSIRALVFIAANCYAGVSISDYPERWLADPDEATAKRLRQGTRAQLHRFWEIFADSFEGRPFIAGEQPGAADLLAAVVSRWSGTRAHVRRHRPALLELVERVEQSPAVAAVFARHWPA